MTLQKSFIQWWNHFFFREVPPHLMAIFRIIFGGFLLFYFALQIPHVAILYSREGILLPMFSATTLWGLFAAPPAWAAQIIFWTFLLSLLCLTLGAGTRVAASVAFLLYVYYWCLSLFQFGTSFDRLFITTVFLLIWSGCGNTFSIDMWRKRGSFFAWEPTTILIQRILAIQISATYLGVGWQKLFLPDWQSGEVLAWGFTGRWATPLAYYVARLNWPLWVYDWLVYANKAFEITIPFGLWSKKYRWWFMAGGAIFHILIALLLAIWWFLALIPAYIVFFEPEEVQKFVKR